MKKAVIAVALVIVLALAASNVLLWLEQAGTLDLAGEPKPASPQSPTTGSSSGDLESRVSALEREAGIGMGSNPFNSRIDRLESDVRELRGRFPSNPFR